MTSSKPKIKYKQKISFNFNPDIDKNDIDEKVKIKDDIVQFLKTLGEVNASKFLENEFLNQKKLSAQDIDDEFLDELIKLSKTNKSILDILKKIEANMIDEQDTSIRRYKMSESKNSERKQQEYGEEDSEFDLSDLAGIDLPFDIDRSKRNRRVNRLRERRLRNKFNNKFEEERQRKLNNGATDKEILEQEERRNNNGKTLKEIEEEKNKKTIDDHRKKVEEKNNKSGNTDNKSGNTADIDTGKDKSRFQKVLDYLRKNKKMNLAVAAGTIGTAIGMNLNKDLDDLLNEVITYEEFIAKVEEAKKITSDGVDLIKKGYDEAQKLIEELGPKALEIGSDVVSGAVDTMNSASQATLDFTTPYVQEAMQYIKDVNESQIDYGKNVQNVVFGDEAMFEDDSAQKYNENHRLKIKENFEKTKNDEEVNKSAQSKYDEALIKATHRFENKDYIGAPLELFKGFVDEFEEKQNLSKFSDAPDAELNKFVVSLVTSTVSGLLSTGIGLNNWYTPHGKLKLTEEQIAQRQKKYEQSKNSESINIRKNGGVPFIESEADEKIDKMFKRGILSKDEFSLINISNFNEISKLSTTDLIELFYRDDFAEESKKMLGEILSKKQKKVVVPPEELMKVESNEEIIFNDQDILAYSLLTAKNELDQFLAENPFTDENVEKLQKMIDGKSVEVIQYVNPELNEKYVKLKEQYDEDYKRYAQNRRNQISQLEDFVEVQGEIMSKQEFQQFTEQQTQADISGKPRTTAAKFVETKSNKEASATVDDLIAKYKNIAIPSDQISLVDRIIGAEGFTPVAKPDAKNTMAIGHGHQIEKGEEYLLNATITKEHARAMLVAELNERYIPAAEKIPGYDKAPKKVQNALIDMTYNMGVAWYKGWPNLVKDLEAQNYSKVAENLRHSKYARDVKGRAFINANIFDEADKNKGKPEKNETNYENLKVNQTSKISEKTSEPTNQSTENSSQSSEKLNSENAIDSKVKTVAQIESTTQNLLNSEKNITNNTANVAAVAPVINNSISQGKKSNESFDSLLNLFLT